MPIPVVNSTIRMVIRVMSRYFRFMIPVLENLLYLSTTFIMSYDLILCKTFPATTYTKRKNVCNINFLLSPICDIVKLINQHLVQYLVTNILHRTSAKLMPYRILCNNEKTLSAIQTWLSSFSAM